MSRLRAVSTLTKNAKDELYKSKEIYGIEPVRMDLPKITQSLCPECGQLILARVEEQEGKVIMRKSCPTHGWFEDVLSSDVGFYLRMERWFFGDGQGVVNPQSQSKRRTCPLDCGLCPRHTSHTALANIDLTNRCNLNCPICFANAGAAGYLYEPNYGQVVRMLRNFREMKPVPASCIQFSGGEPTLHPYFLALVQDAKNMGFSAIQIATNGIKFADLDFAQRTREAGVHSLYLQFDAVWDRIYEKMRGRPLLEKKLAVIENCRKVGIKVVLVPTIAKGVNEKEVGNILRLAIRNVDVVSGVSYQPIVFTGRFSEEERKRRYTLSDLAFDIEKQVGFVKAKDWVPLTCSSPLSRMLGAMNGKEITTYTCHPHCSAATYLFVDDKGRATQFTDFVNFKPLLEELDVLARRTGISRMKVLSKLRFANVLRKHFHKQRAPEGLTFMKFIRTLYELTDKKYERDESKIGKNTYRTLMVGGMHFMDAYNYDIQRVQRCVVHYAAPNGRIYPFCAYNSGPCYREQIEREFSVP